MSYVKLTVENVQQFEIACEAVDIRIKERRTIGKKEYIIVSIRNPSQLYELGLVQASLPDDIELGKEVTEFNNAIKLQGAALLGHNQEETEKSAIPPDYKKENLYGTKKHK
jgi:hypothetical protein